jgi:hypothetical protein
MQSLKWTDRKFDFGFKKEYLPFLIERIKATVPRIEELVKNISESDLSKQEDNQWSVKQHIGHLIDLEELHEARVDQFANGIKELDAADMTNKKTYEASHNQKNVSGLITGLRHVRNHFVCRLETFNENKLNSLALHPRLLKQITVVDLTYFVGEHDNHHLTIISQLIKSLNK